MDEINKVYKKVSDDVLNIITTYENKMTRKEILENKEMLELEINNLTKELAKVNLLLAKINDLSITNVKVNK